MSELMVHICARSAPSLVTIAGEVDTVCAPQLRRRLRAVPTDDLVLDVSGVRFLDATGLGVLAELQARLERANARMVLAAAPRAVLRIATIPALDHTFRTSQTVDGAVALLADRSGRNGSKAQRTGR